MVFAISSEEKYLTWHWVLYIYLGFVGLCYKIICTSTLKAAMGSIVIDTFPWHDPYFIRHSENIWSGMPWTIQVAYKWLSRSSLLPVTCLGVVSGGCSRTHLPVHRRLVKTNSPYPHPSWITRTPSNNHIFITHHSSAKLQLNPFKTVVKIPT